MATTGSAIAQVEKKREREYTPKQKKFLRLYANNNFQDALECAKKAGYSHTGGYKAIESLKEDIIEIASSLLLGAAPQAAMTVVEALSATGPLGISREKLQAAKEVLDRVGIVKQEEITHNHQVSGGLFVIPAKNTLPSATLEIEDDGEYVEDAEEYIEAEYEYFDEEGKDTSDDGERSL